MFSIINATPHDVNIIGENGQVVRTYAASGICPRCSVSREAVDEIDGIRINRTVFGDIVGLPEYVEGTYYIVSVIVANAAKGRQDLLSRMTRSVMKKAESSAVGLWLSYDSRGPRVLKTSLFFIFCKLQRSKPFFNHV